VERNFNPEVGFLRRTDFRRNFAELRFSPRPRNHPYVRRLTYKAGLDYITDNENVLESRELQGSFRTDFHNSDSLTVEHSRLFELLRDPFQIARTVRIPVGATISRTRGSRTPAARSGRFQARWRPKSAASTAAPGRRSSIAAASI
jgi:hypothetical protein